MVQIKRHDGSVSGGEISPQEFEKMLRETAEADVVRPGEMVTGRVVSIGKESVFVDIGCKSEGILDIKDFLDEGDLKIKVGDQIEATVISLRGGISLSRSLKKNQQNSGVLLDAYENRIPVEGVVTELRKGGFGVQLGGVAAFCPVSQIDNHFVDKPEIHVGQTYTFRIIEHSEDGHNVVVSRRALLEEESKARARETRELLNIGALMQGTVRKLMPFGAFVDVGGMDGLVHVSEISWDRVEDPATVLQEGQTVQVKVLKFDKETNKLSLSIREAGSDPWDSLEERFPLHSMTAGTVTRVEAYGAFVRIAQGIEGLVHISDMSWVGRLRHASEAVSVGDSVQVSILGIDRAKKRISLGIKQINSDPFEAAKDRYVPGAAVTGTVQRIGAGGVFIELQEGIVAFLPGSLAGTTRGEPLGSIYKVGAQVKLVVREVEAERRRITLEAGKFEMQEERNDFDQYVKSTGVKAFTMGTFGELLMKSKEKGKKK